MAETHDKVYRSAVDWWLAILLCFPVIGGFAALIAGASKGESLSMFIGGGALVFYALLMFGLILPIRYTIGAEGFRLRAGMQKLKVPWDRLGKVEKSSNPLSSPALSMKRLHVEYEKPNGREAWVLISPTDRDQFLQDLAAASPRHTLDGDVLRVKLSDVP